MNLYLILIQSSVYISIKEKLFHIIFKIVTSIFNFFAKYFYVLHFFWTEGIPSKEKSFNQNKILDCSLKK